MQVRTLLNLQRHLFPNKRNLFSMGINLLDKLNNIRSKNNEPTNSDVLEGFKVLLSKPNEGERILGNLFSSHGNQEDLNFDTLV